MGLPPKNQLKMTDAPKCAGYKSLDQRCKSNAVTGTDFCRHHQYQYNYADYERGKIAEYQSQIRTEKQRQSLRNLVAEKNEEKIAKKLTQMCHSKDCNIYNTTTWDSINGYWKCKNH